jgi:arginine-tRNA-protein transferase
MDEEVYGIYAKYQKEIHHEPPSKISRRGFKRFLVDSPLKASAIIHTVSYTNFD